MMCLRGGEHIYQTFDITDYWTRSGRLKRMEDFFEGWKSVRMEVVTTEKGKSQALIIQTAEGSLMRVQEIVSVYLKYKY